jgi:hypothetical protein
MGLNLHSIAARVLIIASSVWTAALQLFSTTSLAYRAAGPGLTIDVVNVIVLCISALAVADVVWHDVLRRGLVWPSFPRKARHRICVWVYTSLAGAFAIRAFVATGDTAAALPVGGYYVLLAVGIAVEAAALAHEQRDDATCQQAPGDA